MVLLSQWIQLGVFANFCIGDSSCCCKIEIMFEYAFDLYLLILFRSLDIFHWDFVFGV